MQSCTICIVRGFHHGFEICVKFGWSDQWSIDMMQSAVEVRKKCLEHMCLLMFLQVYEKNTSFSVRLYKPQCIWCKIPWAYFHHIRVFDTSSVYWQLLDVCRAFLMRLGLDFKFNYVGTPQFFWIRSCGAAIKGTWHSTQSWRGRSKSS